MKFNYLLRCCLCLITLLGMSLGSCKKNTPDDTNYTFTPAELADLRAKICLTVGADDPYAMSDTPENGAQDRAAGAKNKFWEPGKILRVRFLNGSTTLQNKVFAYAEQWEAFANINFVRVASGTADIRVAFDPGKGNFSYLGKDNIDIPANQKTMNLEFNANTKGIDIEGTTLHEFGHALGLNHEQQQPLANIPWNVPAVYSFYGGAPNYWSKNEIDHNVLNKTAWVVSQHTNYDSKSIMQYSVDAKLTTNGFFIPENYQLSALDKEFIGKMYSTKRFRVRHAANTNTEIIFWVNGIYHTLKSGESLWVLAQTTSNKLSIWECINGNCNWDSYTAYYNNNFKIVTQSADGNLKLLYD